MNINGRSINVTEDNWWPLSPEWAQQDLEHLRRAAKRHNVDLDKAFGNRRPSTLIEVDTSGSTARIRFSGVAGHIVLAGNVFNVRPKFMIEDQWQSRLVRLATLGLPTSRDSVALLPGSVKAAVRSHILADLVAQHYVAVLSRALDDHPLWLYERHRANRTYVKGRILVAKHASNTPDKRHRIPCAYSQLTLDNRVVRLLRWACVELERRVRLATSRRHLRRLADRLPAVNAGRPPLTNLIRPVPPNAKVYREPVRIALELARSGVYGRAAEERSLTHPTSMATVAVFMHKSFEGLVSVLMRRVARELEVKHARQLPMPLASRTGKGVGEATRSVKPDDVLYVWKNQVPGQRRNLIVVDAKYKGRLERSGDLSVADRARLGREDFYQSTATLLATGAPVGVLVQPRPEDLSPEIGEHEVWRIDKGTLLTEVMHVGIIRLDLLTLTSPSDVVNLQGQVLRLIKYLLGTESSQLSE